MVVHPDVATLLALVPAEHAGGEQFVWTDVESVLGTELPSDYKAMLDTYGVGDLGGLNVLPPLPSEVRGPRSAHIGSQINHVRWLWDHDGGIPGEPFNSDAVLPWGGGLNSHVFTWLMISEDPDDWAVAVYRRQVDPDEPHWAWFDCGMVQFLTRMMLGQFEKCPLDDTSLWQRTKPFVSWREQERRLQAGQDPITGEFDPMLAEMVAQYRHQD